MKSSCRLAFVFSLCAVATGGTAELPPAVADRFESVISFDESDPFVGSYHITISSVIQKPNGKSRKENLIEADITRKKDGTSDRRLVVFLEDGSVVTEAKRKKFESEDSGRGGNDDDDLLPPFGSSADSYRFSAPESRGSAVVMKFEPAPGREKDENIARGEIAWDQSSLDPLWLEMTAVDPPIPLRKLEFRTEYTRIDDQIFVARLVSQGIAKIVLIKREFHMEIWFDDIRPEVQIDE